MRRHTEWNWGENDMRNMIDRQQSYFDCSIRHIQYVLCIFISSLLGECWKKDVWEGEKETQGKRERETGLRHVTGGMAAPTRTASLSFHAKILARERAVRLCVHCCIPFKNCVCAISKLVFLKNLKSRNKNLTRINLNKIQIRLSYPKKLIVR